MQHPADPEDIPHNETYHYFARVSLRVVGRGLLGGQTHTILCDTSSAKLCKHEVLATLIPEPTIRLNHCFRLLSAF